MRVKILLTSALLATTVAWGFNAVPQAVLSPQLPVNMGSCQNFLLLAYSEITNTSVNTHLTGNLGLSPAAGTFYSGLSQANVTGTIFTVDGSGPAGNTMDVAGLNSARGDLTAAYNDAAGRVTPDVVYGVPTNIGGLTLAPGLYKFSDSAAISGSNLTLAGPASGVWIFQIASTLTVANGIKVILSGGAQAANIFWQVSTSATMGTSSHMEGTVMANASIAFQTGSSLNGRALARTAAVTLDSFTGVLPCAATSGTVTVSENFEGAQSGGGFDNAGWTKAALHGTASWAWSSAQSKSITHSWYSPSQASASDRVLVSPAYTLTPASSLSFWHTRNFQNTVMQTNCPDGGLLELSADNGVTWLQIPASAFSSGGYNGVVGSASNVLNGRNAWCGGTISAMTPVNVSLSAWSGQGVRLRWHAADDAATALTGWYVDSVAFNNVQTAGACSACTSFPGLMSGLKHAKSGANLVETWTAATNAVTYNVYRGTTANPAGWTAPAVAAGLTQLTWTDVGQLSSLISQFYSITNVSSCGLESPK